MEKTKIGRPPLDEKRSERIYVRVTPNQKKFITEKAEKYEIGISELIIKAVEKY